MHCDVRIFEWLFQYIHSSRVKTASGSSGGGSNNNTNAENTRRDDSGCISNGGDGSAGGNGGGDAGSRRASSEKPDGAAPPPLEVGVVLAGDFGTSFLTAVQYSSELDLLSRTCFALPVRNSCMFFQDTLVFTLQQYRFRRSMDSYVLCSRTKAPRWSASSFFFLGCEFMTAFWHTYVCLTSSLLPCRISRGEVGLHLCEEPPPAPQRRC